MAIWQHQSLADVVQETDVTDEACLFCSHDLRVLTAGGNVHEWNLNAFKVCDKCGWWSTYRMIPSAKHFEGISRTLPGFRLEGACARLKKLDLADISNPAEEVRNYLVAKYEERFEVQPRKWEEVVGSVFKDLGYDVVITAYQHDEGIDIILSNDSDLVGVQVKRSKNRIQVSQIRELAGALLLGGYTKGCFVTTSDFTKGAEDAGVEYDTRGYPIELIDAPRFFDALYITQRSPYSDDDFHVLAENCETVLIYEDFMD